MMNESDIIAIPFPLQGHINPFLQFCKHLASRGLKITLLIFSNQHLFQTLHSNPSLTVQTVSHPLLEIPSDSQHNIRVVVTETLAQILAKQETNVSCIVYDSTFPWILDIARQFGIDGASFFTQPCAVYTVFYHVHQGNLSLPVQDQTVSLPALPFLKTSELPSFVYDIQSYPSFTTYSVNQLSNIKDVDWVFFNSFDALEEEVINWWTGNVRKVMPIGPTIPSAYLENEIDDDREYGLFFLKPEADSCMKWLDSKESGSVVYVSFGSLATLSKEQMEEVAWGLIESKSYFLWVVREDEREKLPIKFLEDTAEKGLIVGWCHQLDVLAHKSVGCFMTHCGWNSTVEALCLGVPLIALPQWADQTTNAKLIADVWQTGIRAKADEKGFVTKQEVEHCINEIMVGGKRTHIRQNTEKWKNLANEAIGKGGSSEKNINDFVTKYANSCN